MIAPLPVLFAPTQTTRVVPFQFLDPGELREEELTLRLRETSPATGERAPTYRFEMIRHGDGALLGTIELRVGNSFDIVQYTGHIGYRVESAYRGRRYAARGCRLLFSLARRHGFSEIWVTCDTDNSASYRTCELIGGKLISTVPIPKSHPYYQTGSRAKCRFRVEL